MRRWTPALGALLVFGATCRDAPAPRRRAADEHDRFVAHMGRMDAHVIEVQRSAGDPVEPDLIRLHLAAIRGELEEVSRAGIAHEDFRPRARRAISTLRELELKAWTPDSREDQYATLRALCAGCHAVCSPPAPEVAVERPDSWTSCGRCHQKVYAEWKETLHAQAWKDPVYRLSAGNPPKLECRGCHSMEPILEREISADVSYRPRFRPDRRDEGVNCLACHGLSDGSVAAARDLPGAPCRPRRDERLLSPVFCGACHNPSHLAYDEWKTSSSGKTCSDCHARKEGRFTHRMSCVQDPDFVRKALSWTCAVEGDRLSIALTNRSGHKLPAEVPSRVLRLVIRIGEATEEILFRRPAKQSVGLKDNRLLPDETRTFVRDLKGAKAAGVEIFYQQSPLVPQEGWVSMGSWALPR